jgi:hypothetical protein
VTVTSPGAWLGNGVDLAVLPRIAVRERTSWSCHHGVARWGAECPCAAESQWKAPLRAAFDRLAVAVDVRTELAAAELGVDAWAARDRYVDVASDFAEPEAWAAHELEAAGRPSGPTERTRLLALMGAQSSRLAMFASCGWFWDDPRRPEVQQVLRFAAHAAHVTDTTLGTHVEGAFREDLGAVVAPAHGTDGERMLRAALRVIDRAI